MSAQHPLKAVGVALAIALVCALLVTATHLWLAPAQQAWVNLERYRNVLDVSSLMPAGNPSERELATLMQQLDTRQRELTIRSGERIVTNNALLFLVWRDDRLARVVVPVSGQGMWAPIEGFLALEPDLVTVAAITFHVLNDTPGIGDKVQDPAWRNGWRGKRIYDEAGAVRLSLTDSSKPDPVYEVDAIAGATVTANAVVNMIRHQLGPEVYGPWLDELRREGVKPP